MTHLIHTFRSFLSVLLLLSLTGCAAQRGGSTETAAGIPPDEGAVILFVRLESGLSRNDAIMTMHEREPKFRNVPGLLQKIYGEDPSTGEFCGIYIFASQESLDAFRQSQLAQSIPQEYEASSARLEHYELLLTLYPGVRR